MCAEPPYTGGDPEVRHIEVNPGVEEGRFNLWRDLRAMYTRIEVVYDQCEATEYFLFERLQVCLDESLHANQYAQVIHHTPAHVCIPRNDICLRYNVSTDLLIHELKNLERAGGEIILPAGTRWGLIPVNEEHWELYECAFCGVKYCAPTPM